MSHHYDEHDHDKLVRWREELAGADVPGSEFPAAALFLVKPTATGAHEVFRKFRGVFEERNAPFANLVVFGMHGVSATVRALLQEAGLSESDLPVLLMAPTNELANSIALTLPSGESLEGGDDPTATAPAISLRRGGMFSTASALPGMADPCVSWASRASSCPVSKSPAWRKLPWEPGLWDRAEDCDVSAPPFS